MAHVLIRIACIAFLLILSCEGMMPMMDSLKFQSDGTFKIVQLADLHLGESDELDKQTLDVRV